ncbi:MAG: substrate-binding domain-containing protein [Deltaproteobacteria bacterium]|nr:substrate-binding domain-containing protein [Deltaproteobacteria bacterium]
MRRRFAICTVLALALGACQQDSVRLLFHSGAGQRSSLDAIVPIWEARHPGVRVDCAYKGSGYFLADIRARQEGDLYMPGEVFYLEQAAERGYLVDYDPERDVAAYFLTVILTARGNPAGVHGLRDFARPGVRVALGDPQANAIGIWHQKLFRAAGIYEQVKRNAVMNAQCIPEIGNALKLGAADASIVWAATAVLYLADCEIAALPERERGLIPLPVSVLRFSRHPRLAADLKRFLLSEEARALFHEHAYVVDPAQADSDVDWLIKAAAVAKNPDSPISPATVGHLVGEVRRQRR